MQRATQVVEVRVDRGAFRRDVRLIRQRATAAESQRIKRQRTGPRDVQRGVERRIVGDRECSRRNREGRTNLKAADCVVSRGGNSRELGADRDVIIGAGNLVGSPVIGVVSVRTIPAAVPGDRRQHSAILEQLKRGKNGLESSASTASDPPAIVARDTPYTTSSQRWKTPDHGRASTIDGLPWVWVTSSGPPNICGGSHPTTRAQKKPPPDAKIGRFFCRHVETRPRSH